MKNVLLALVGVALATATLASANEEPLCNPVENITERLSTERTTVMVVEERLCFRHSGLAEVNWDPQPMGAFGMITRGDRGRAFENQYTILVPNGPGREAKLVLVGQDGAQYRLRVQAPAEQR